VAEIARLEGRDADAMRLYEEAIHSAGENGFVQNEGLAHEVAARFYAARASRRSTHACLREARRCYRRWGAFGKVRHSTASSASPRRTSRALSHHYHWRAGSSSWIVGRGAQGRA